MPLPPGTARPVVAAGAVFRDDAGRVLLVHPTYKPGWDVPGGTAGAGVVGSEAFMGLIQPCGFALRQECIVYNGGKSGFRS